MIILASTFFGGAYGAWLARSRGGNRFDIAQYAAVLGILGALIGLFGTILLGRVL